MFRFRRRKWLRLRALALCAAAIGTLIVPAQAAASEIIWRNAYDLRLTADARGRAVVHFSEADGTAHHVLVWGAINARKPSQGGRQVRFEKDYSGGVGRFGSAVWRQVQGCPAYRGPELPWFVTGCTAPDGTHWAVQAWQRMLPNYGVPPWKPSQSVWEVHLSHFSGELPKLEIWLDWVYSGRFHHLLGRYTYRGEPVHGFASTSTGAPLDTFGRNIYLDTYGSAYSSGWARENSFLAHRPNGNFCYGFYPHQGPSAYGAVARPAGQGSYYRATVMGPGVTPLVLWHGPGLPDYNRADRYHAYYEAWMNAFGDRLRGNDRHCRQH